MCKAEVEVANQRVGSARLARAVQGTLQPTGRIGVGAAANLCERVQCVAIGLVPKRVALADFVIRIHQGAMIPL